MSNLPTRRLPRVVLSSVVRSSHQGESHGGLYIVDLETGRTDLMLDWNDPTISWEGRGADRGLRGIAFHADNVYLAASDEIFVYDARFGPLRSFRNPYLKHCHEIFIHGDSLFATSTGFDSVLELDLVQERFVRGDCVRFGLAGKLARKATLRLRPRHHVFDPSGEDGPDPGDTVHVNNVTVQGRTLFVSGTGLGNVWAIRGGRVHSYARVPLGSHNARPFRGGVLMNHTASDRVAFVSRRGRVLRSYPLPRYPEDRLQHSNLTRDKARQAFGRGLAVIDDDLFVGGSSPATVTVYRFDPPSVVRSINVTMDIRNAVHGLEICPGSVPDR